MFETPWHRSHVIVPGSACSVHPVDPDHEVGPKRGGDAPRTPGPAPARVWAGRRVWDVVEIQATWREWSVRPADPTGGPTDLECWRVRLDPPLVALLCRDLATGAWHVRNVWD